MLKQNVVMELQLMLDYAGVVMRKIYVNVIQHSLNVNVQTVADGQRRMRTKWPNHTECISVLIELEYANTNAVGN